MKGSGKGQPRSQCLFSDNIRSWGLGLERVSELWQRTKISGYGVPSQGRIQTIATVANATVRFFRKNPAFPKSLFLHNYSYLFLKLVIHNCLFQIYYFSCRFWILYFNFWKLFSTKLFRRFPGISSDFKTRVSRKNKPAF